jgi:desulfoferrodoxin-like iron-binding protein
MIKTEKNEKHKPKVEVKEFDRELEIKIAVGEVLHPTTLDHHIRSIDVYYKPKEGEAKLIFRTSFFPEKEVKPIPIIKLKLLREGKGKLIVLAHCNMHGTWMEEIEV